MPRQIRTLLVDLGLIALATFAGLLLREDLQISLQRAGEILPHVAWTLLIAAPALYASGLHRSIWRYTSHGDYFKILIVSTIAVAGAMALGFSVNRLSSIPRSLPLLQLLLMMAMLGLPRYAARLLNRNRLIKAARSTAVAADALSIDQQPVLVIGLNPLTDLYLQSVREFAADHIKIVGLLGRSERHTGRLLQGFPILGTPEQVADIVQDFEVHGIVVKRIVVALNFGRLSAAAQEALLELERTSDVSVEFLGESLGLTTTRQPGASAQKPLGSDDDVFANALTDLEEQAIVNRPFWMIKRVIDVVGAAALIVLALPLMVVIAVFVAIDVGLPTVFWQQRPGTRGRPFKLYKFRTMTTAHDRLGQRIADEHRSTTIGRLLRRFRLDELPQLFNILIGDMSFIGPRPLLPVDQPSGRNPRLLVRPGLTGWAQVSGGRDISVIEKAALDLWYLRHASLWLDLRIFLRTAVMVLHGERRDEVAIRKAHRELLKSAAPGE